MKEKLSKSYANFIPVGTVGTPQFGDTQIPHRYNNLVFLTVSVAEKSHYSTLGHLEPKKNLLCVHFKAQNSNVGLGIFIQVLNY